MQTWTALLAAATMAVAGPTQAASSGDTVSTITASGEGNWEMICHIVRPGGDQIVRILEHDRNTYSDASLLRASCEIRNTRKSPLVVTIAAPTMKCPFKTAAADTCTQTFAPGRAGSFELVHR